MTNSAAPDTRSLTIALLGGGGTGLLSVYIGDPLEKTFGGGFPGDDLLALLYPQFWVPSLLFAAVGLWLLRRLWPEGGGRLWLIFPSSVLSYWCAYLTAIHLSEAIDSLWLGGFTAGVLGALIALGPVLAALRLPDLAPRLLLVAAAGGIAGLIVRLIPEMEFTALYALHAVWQASVLCSLLAWPQARRAA